MRDMVSPPSALTTQPRSVGSDTAFSRAASAGAASIGARGILLQRAGDGDLLQEALSGPSPTAGAAATRRSRSQRDVLAQFVALEHRAIGVGQARIGQRLVEQESSSASSSFR